MNILNEYEIKVLQLHTFKDSKNSNKYFLAGETKY